MPKKKKKVAYCKTCDYIRSHKNNGINADLMGGIPMQAITRRTGLGLTTLKRHRDEGHMMDRFLPAIASTKQAKAELDLLECAREIYDDCKDNAAKAKGVSKTPRDFRDASGCWDAATKALGILKPEEKPVVNQTNTVNNYDKLTKEELRSAIALAAKLQGAEEGVSEEKPD